MRGYKVDTNQAEIVAALRAVGCSVAITAAAGGGFPDLVVGCRGFSNYLIEVKDGSKPKSRRKLTGPQVDFHKEWRGQIGVAETVDDALRIVGVLT